MADSIRRPFRTALLDWFKTITVSLALWLLLRTFLIQAFRIPSGSMENTLLVGDFLFVNKALYGAEIPLTDVRLPAVREPRRGDLVVFKSVEQDLMVVKRLIGAPGDTLAMVHGDLWRNGQAVVEPYVVHLEPRPSAAAPQRERMRAWQAPHYVGNTLSRYRPDLQDWGPIVVPPDSFFVMGDNRDMSHDSRMWGFLPRENIRGHPMFVYYSYDSSSWRALKFFSAVRWDRLLSVPR